MQRNHSGHQPKLVLGWDLSFILAPSSFTLATLQYQPLADIVHGGSKRQKLHPTSRSSGRVRHCKMSEAVALSMSLGKDGMDC